MTRKHRFRAGPPRKSEAWWRLQRLARDAYLNDAYPERKCDRCGKVYRGPALYCSLDCAVADA
jgi:hypothetical protein